MASEISSISHLGVEVAPQTPMELAPANRELNHGKLQISGY